jgi:predicted PhzF superfamily epimerase YddE/YHI9
VPSTSISTGVPQIQIPATEEDECHNLQIYNTAKRHRSGQKNTTFSFSIPHMTNSKTCMVKFIIFFISPGMHSIQSMAYNTKRSEAVSTFITR